MSRDWAATTIVIGAAVLLVVDLVLLAIVAWRLRTAFRERLDKLPGGSLWRRMTHGGRFWVGAAVHMVIALFLAAFALLAGQFLMRATFAAA